LDLKTNILEVESSSSGECSDDSSDESDSIELQSVSSLERDNSAPDLSKVDEDKLAFATNEMRKGTVHECTKQLPDDIRACVRDRSQFSNEEIMQFREEQLRRVAKLAQSFIDSGEVDTWFKDADPTTRHICRNVNGPLLKALAADFSDVDAVDMFRFGGKIYGDLPAVSKRPFSTSIQQTDCL